MDGTASVVVTLVTAVIALLGGAFGGKLLDKWFDRDKVHAEAAGQLQARQFTDNEHARGWLQEQLKERDDELQTLRANEIALLKQMGDLAERLGRHEERANGQAKEIEALQKAVEKIGTDYREMKAERDEYRAGKHDADNKLTAVSLRAQLAERDLKAREAEIERLKGQLMAIRAMPTAPVGDAVSTGVPGPAGPAGIQGPIGPQGQVGPQGEQGD